MADTPIIDEQARAQAESALAQAQAALAQAQEAQRVAETAQRLSVSTSVFGDGDPSDSFVPEVD